MEAQSVHTNTSDQGNTKGLRPTALHTACDEAGLHRPARSGASSLHKYSLVDIPGKMPSSISSTLRQLHVGWQLPGCLYVKGGQASLIITLISPFSELLPPLPREHWKVPLTYVSLVRLTWNKAAWPERHIKLFFFFQFYKLTCWSLHLLKSELGRTEGWLPLSNTGQG